MFETYYYIDEEKLDCYLSDFYRPKKLKNKGISLEVSLPFIKVSADGVFDKDISTLTARQKAILFESLLESNSQEVFFDLAEDSTDEKTIPSNVFISMKGILRIPEMAGMIRAVSDIFDSKIGEYAYSQLKVNDDITTETVLNVLTEKKEYVPVIIEYGNKSVSSVNAGCIINCDEIDFWDEVGEECEIIAKVTRNCSSDFSVKVFDIGKTYFNISRPFRRNIKDYETNTQFNIFETGVSFKVEIISIKK